MDEVCGYANRPVAFVASYVKSRLLAHAAIGGAVVAAVACSVGAQYGIKVLVDSLAGGVDHGARYVWLGFFLLTGLIAADNLLWRLGGWIASFTFVSVTGDLRRDLFRLIVLPACRHCGTPLLRRKRRRRTSGGSSRRSRIATI